jgi:hypothetical protein
MKKFVVGLVFIKAVFLFSLALVSCQTAELSKLESQVAASPTATPTNSNESINRPTSEPYTGDLSIFEDENRAKNLQIDRVMDILKISTANQSPTSARVPVGLRRAQPNESVKKERFSPSK